MKRKRRDSQENQCVVGVSGKNHTFKSGKGKKVELSHLYLPLCSKPGFLHFIVHGLCSGEHS